MKRWEWIMCAAVMASFMIGGTVFAGNETVIGKGRKVSFDYTLTVDGKIVDSSEGRGPLQYTQGEGQIISGLSQRLEGLKAGDEKTIIVPPQEAYGKINKEAFRPVSRTSLPAGINPQVGMFLKMKGAQGKIFPARIAEVNNDTVMLDLNHPLAGKTLTFQVKIISVE